MNSDHDEWEVLSQASTAHSFHIADVIVEQTPTDAKHHEEHDVDDDDNRSVHSVQSLESSMLSTSSSLVNVNVPLTEQHAANRLHEPSALIPQIDEEHQINIHNQNELIPSYVDIEAELQRQRTLVDELKQQLNEVTNERDQIRTERDDLQERVNTNQLQIARLQERNIAVDRENMVLRTLQRYQRRDGRKPRKQLQSKSGANITNRRGHRPSVPAKLRFRRQRTTHRSVFCRQRNW